MIHIEVDYQGDKSIEIYSFTGTSADYQSKLDEIEAYPGKIDQLKIYTGSNKATPMWDQHPMEVLIETTSVDLAVHRGRKIEYPSVK